MKKYIIPILRTLPSIVPVFFGTAGALIMGYILFVVLLTPLLALIEMSGMVLPFHGPGDKLIIPWKMIVITACILSVIILAKMAREKIKKAGEDADRENG